MRGCVGGGGSLPRLSRYHRTGCRTGRAFFVPSLKETALVEISPCQERREDPVLGKGILLPLDHRELLKASCSRGVKMKGPNGRAGGKQE